MRPHVIEPAEIQRRLETLPAWRYDAEVGALTRSLVFADFSAAFGFMCRVALEAQRLDHHPDWRNSYRRVELALRTHDAGGVTELDFELAARCEASLTDSGLGAAEA